MPQDRPTTAVVCDDRPDVRRTVAGLLVGCGYDVVGQAADFAVLRRLVHDEHPAVIVLALPVTGSSSLGAVAGLRAEDPACSVVVVSAFEQLELAALEAGATALVAENDPQALRAVLQALADGRAPAVPPAPRSPAQPVEAGSVRTNPSS